MLTFTDRRRNAPGVQAEAPLATAAGVMSQPFGSAAEPLPIVPVSPWTVITIVAPRPGGLLVAVGPLALFAAGRGGAGTRVDREVGVQSSGAPGSDAVPA